MENIDQDHKKEDLAAIKERLRGGKITKDDLKVLQSLIERAEKSTQLIRAAIVE